MAASSSKTGFPVVIASRISEIDIKVNGSLVHKYALAYTAGSNLFTSLLSSITETGYDESGNPTVLPATMLKYLSNTKGWTSNANWNLPVAIENNGTALGARMVDVDGDGTPDIIMNDNGTNPGYPKSFAYLNNGHGWTRNDNWIPPVALTTNGADNGYKFVDVNGDGLIDIIRNDSGNASAYINNGHGWTLDHTWDPPTSLTWNLAASDAHIGDINGDGMPDIILGDYVGPGSTRHAWINNGHGWTQDDSWAPPVDFGSAGSDNDEYRILDGNCDGLAAS